MDDASREFANVFDDYSPPQIAVLVETAGIAKARLPALQILTLAVLAGAFIAFGGMSYTQVCLAICLCFAGRRRPNHLVPPPR